MPKIEPKGFFYRIIPNKDIDRAANSEDPDKTASLWGSLMWVSTV